MSEPATDRDVGFTETTHESYFQKMQASCMGVCFGFMLFFGSIGLLVWNEGQTVARQKDLEEGQEVLVDIQLENFNRTIMKDGLVHVTGTLSTPSLLRDDIFGVTTGSTDEQGNGTIAENEGQALRLQRDVKMYQWVEEKTTKQVSTSGGGTRTDTTYSYSKDWSSIKYDSSTFAQQDSNRNNPETWPFEYEEWVASEIFLGNELQLSSAVISEVIWYQPIDNIDIEDIPDEQIQEKVLKESANSLFYKYTNTSSSQNPQIGDMTIAWQVVKPQTISIVADLEDGQMSPFVTSRGGSILLVRAGEYTSDEMFQQANEENEKLGRILRWVGFMLMFFSILLILMPLSTALDIIPFIGDCMGDGLELCVFPCIAFTVAIPVTILVISLAWLAYRPAIAVPIFVGCGALICFFVVRARRVKEANDARPQAESEKVSSFSPGQGDEEDPYRGPASYEPQSQQTQANNYGVTDFSQALDHPPPSATYATAEPEIVMPAPYVPQVYKS